MAENQKRIKYGSIVHRSFHAEMNALFKLGKSLRKTENSRSSRALARDTTRSKTTMYVVRLTYTDEVSSIYSGQRYGISKPCPHCEKALYEHGISRIKYTDVVDGQVVVCEMKRV